LTVVSLSKKSIFSDRADNQEDRRVREVHVRVDNPKGMSIDVGPNYIIVDDVQYTNRVGKNILILLVLTKRLLHIAL
jgi:hypothetical protein